MDKFTKLNEFYASQTNSLVADIRSRTDGQTMRMDMSAHTAQ